MEKSVKDEANGLRRQVCITHLATASPTLARAITGHLSDRPGPAPVAAEDQLAVAGVGLAGGAA